MKKEEYKEVDFSKAMEDIKKMILDTHEVKQVKDGYEYNGEDITHHSILAISHTIKDSVTEKALAYDKEQGRDFLDVILSKVFQLGYSQACIIKQKDIDLLHGAIELLTKRDKDGK